MAHLSQLDTIKPVITVINASDNIVLYGEYQDPGTVITDANNTSYDGTVLATHKHLDTWSAKHHIYSPADAAGNSRPCKQNYHSNDPKPLGIAPGLAISS